MRLFMSSRTCPLHLVSAYDNIYLVNHKYMIIIKYMLLTLLLTELLSASRSPIGISKKNENRNFLSIKKLRLQSGREDLNLRPPAPEPWGTQMPENSRVPVSL